MAPRGGGGGVASWEVHSQNCAFGAPKQPFLAQKGPETKSKLTHKGKRSVHYTCALIAS